MDKHFLWHDLVGKKAIARDFCEITTNFDINLIKNTQKSLDNDSVHRSNVFIMLK